ncbi:hypothetical protein V8C40DRAFT_236581 [Trichoderma camerunense]
MAHSHCLGRGSRACTTRSCKSTSILLSIPGKYSRRQCNLQVLKPTASLQYSYSSNLISTSHYVTHCYRTST